MTHSLFIVSFRRDFQFLPGLLASISKFTIGFDEVVLLVPNTDRGLISGFGLTKEHVEYFDEPMEGHIAQQWAKCHADLWCDGEYIFHVDSDCLFTSPATPKDYFHYGNPILLGTKYDELNYGKPWPGASPWRPCTERILGESVEYETMRRLPIVYHRDTYPKFREHVKNVHGVELTDYMRPIKESLGDPTKSISEFCAMGAFSWSHLPNLYYLWDTAKAEPPPSHLAQFWSRGGVEWKMDHAPFEGQSFRQVSERILK